MFVVEIIGGEIVDKSPCKYLGAPGSVPQARCPETNEIVWLTKKHDKNELIT